MIENLKYTRLLYIEDDDVIRKQYAYVFRNFFAEVIEACSALEGLEYFQTQSIQCIISDIVMDEMNGIEFIQEIRKLNQKIPVVILSSHPTQNFLLESIKLNLTSFLIKPVSFSDIKDTLEICVEKMIDNQLLSVQLDANCHYSPINKILTVMGEQFKLPKKESILLELLLQNRQTLVSKERIAEVVYFDQEMSDSALKNLILKLRKKLSSNILINIPGHGFMLQ